jgi:curved DNA-binding protein CbpA
MVDNQFTAERDHHDMLGVDVNASFAVTKHAYRQLIRTYHPDKFANAPATVRSTAEEHTKILNAANEVLSDQVSGADYDRARLQHTSMQPTQPARPQPPYTPRAEPGFFSWTKPTQYARTGSQARPATPHDPKPLSDRCSWDFDACFDSIFFC